MFVLHTAKVVRSFMRVYPKTSLKCAAAPNVFFNSNVIDVFTQNSSQNFSTSKIREKSAPNNSSSESVSVITPSKFSTFMSSANKNAPGFAAAVAVASAGTFAAEYLGQALLAFQGVSGGNSPISGIPVAILLGLGINNLSSSLPERLTPGLKTCTTTVLRAGIICVGAKLSCFDVVKLGVAGVPVVMSAVGMGLLFTTQLAKFAGLPARMGSLIAAGTSICGVTAITAVAPVIKASPRDTAVAVANVVAFGTMGMLIYPYVAHSLLPASEQIGLFLGTAVHVRFFSL